MSCQVCIRAGESPCQHKPESTPVAIGSSVPPCPTRLTRCGAPYTANDVHGRQAAGLVYDDYAVGDFVGGASGLGPTMERRALTGQVRARTGRGGLFRLFRREIFHQAVYQIQHPVALGEGVVQDEPEIRNLARLKPAPEVVADEPGRRAQRVHRLALLVLSPIYADVHLGVLYVGGGGDAPSR